MYTTQSASFRPLPLLTAVAAAFCLMAMPSAAGDPRWVVYESNDTTELFAEYETDVHSIHRELSAVSAELEQILGLKGGEQRVQIILLKSHDSYRQYLRSRIPEGTNRRAIFYKYNDIFQIYAFRHAQLMTDLRHEYTHALLHQSLPFIPLWLDEGLAEYMEERPDERMKSSRYAGMKWRCRSGWQPRLDDLEQIPSASGMTAAHYRNSWAWVHYLINNSEQSRSRLRQYVQAISAGEAPGAFSEWATQQDPLVLKHLGSYFRRFQISLR